MYSSMDSTALVYTDPAAASPLYDHPYRWISWLVYPAGAALDYGLNRPFYDLADSAPSMSGFTSEDATLHSLRYSIQQ
jgi:hypothetical protein